MRNLNLNAPNPPSNPLLRTRERERERWRTCHTDTFPAYIFIPLATTTHYTVYKGYLQADTFYLRVIIEVREFFSLFWAHSRPKPIYNELNCTVKQTRYEAMMF